MDFLIAFYYQGIDYDAYSYISPNPSTGFFTLNVNSDPADPCPPYGDSDADAVCDNVDNCLGVGNPRPGR